MALPLAIPIAIGAANLLGGLFGSKKVKQVDSTPSDIKGLRGQLAGYLGNNMGDLRGTATTSGFQNVDRTGDVQGPTWTPLQQANAGRINTSGVYGNLQNWRPNTRTDAVQFGGIGSAGTGGTGNLIAQLGRQRDWSKEIGANGGAPSVGARQIDPNTQTQSVADLGQGFAGQFMQNYSPLFEQQRQQALAAAKEASGNLTGSGFANALGNATAQTLAQQQGRLADLAQFGIGQEMQRQQAGAQMDFARNAQNVGNDLQAQLANQQAGLSGRQMNLSALLQGAGLNQSGLQAALAGENMNLGREQDRLTNQAQLGAQVGLQNRGMDSAELQNASEMDLRRLLGLAGMQQADATNQAGLDWSANQFNAGQFNGRGDLMAQMQQQLGLANRGMNSQEAQFWAQLQQQNQQFNAGQMNDMSNANANRFTGLLGNMATAGVGAPQTYQQKNFFDALAGGANAALPFLRSGTPAPNTALMDIAGGYTPGPSANVPGYTGGYQQTPSSSMGPQMSMMPNRAWDMLQGGGGGGGGMAAMQQFLAGGGTSSRPAGAGGLEVGGGAPPGGAPPGASGGGIPNRAWDMLQGGGGGGNPMQAMQGFLASLKNPGSGMGTQDGGRPAGTYLNDLPFMRVAG